MAVRSLSRNALASVLTAVSVALGTGLTLAVLLLARGAESAFEKTARGVPVLVAGTGGSRIDAVLAALYHTGRAPGRIDRAYLERLARDPRVEWLVPVCLGDRVRGYPLVGTTPDFFRHLGLTVRGAVLDGEGRPAVVGARTGFALGDTFTPSHGGIEGDTTHAHERFTVTGLLEPSGTAHDRAVFVRESDFLALSGHDAGGVTAALLKPANNSPMVVEPLLRDIGESKEAQAVRPAQVVRELTGLFGTAQRVLQIVAALVVAVAAISVSVSLYNTMAARRREIALLRVVGARRRFVVAVSLLESTILCVAGALLGLLLGHAGAHLAAPAIERYAGAAFAPGFLFPEEPLLVLLMAAVGVASGALPAWRAYRIDVAAALAGR